MLCILHSFAITYTMYAVSRLTCFANFRSLVSIHQGFPIRAFFDCHRSIRCQNAGAASSVEILTICVLVATNKSPSSPIATLAGPGGTSASTKVTGPVQLTPSVSKRTTVLPAPTYRELPCMAMGPSTPRMKRCDQPCKSAVQSCSTTLWRTRSCGTFSSPVMWSDGLRLYAMRCGLRGEATAT